nr:ribonuclease E/G [uncultured Rhodopila sp.]
MTVSIRVASSPGEAHVAAVRGNRLLDYALWRPGSPDGVGDVHVGRVIAAVPAMAGAFVALADAEGFLPDSEGAKGLTAGTMLAVRITRAAQGSKGPRLTARADEAASGPVGLLRRGPGPAVRLAERYPVARVLVDDPAVAAALGADLGARVSVVGTVLDEDVAEAIDALSRPVVDLPGGARLSIWPTPALVAIDVDGAGALAGGRGRHEALNREVLPVLAEQIRLRNLSGGIVVDLAGMAARKRAALAPDFVRALAEDPLHPRFLGFTALGLAEIVRARVHPPLHELLSGPLAAGLAALRAVMGEYGRDPRGMKVVRAHPSVVSALETDGAALSDLARRTGRRVMLRSDPSLADMAWTLETENG